mgnify:CR=1 FL=1
MSRENDSTGEYTMETSSEIGEVKIADDVVATIAGLATTEVEGVASMQGNLTNEIVGKLGVRNLSKGVKIELMEGMVHAELSVMMKYGYSIPKTCRMIQERVKNAIENMTGLGVESVNIRIVGVDTGKSK